MFHSPLLNYRFFSFKVEYDTSFDLTFADGSEESISRDYTRSIETIEVFSIFFCSFREKLVDVDHRSQCRCYREVIPNFALVQYYF